MISIKSNRFQGTISERKKHRPKSLRLQRMDRLIVNADTGRNLGFLFLLLLWLQSSKPIFPHKAFNF